jgi:hypothetical protein
VSATPHQMGSARLDRALDRLADHCEAVTRMMDAIEDRRPVVLAQLEQELGPELTRVLLTGLVPAR